MLQSLLPRCEAGEPRKTWKELHKKKRRLNLASALRLVCLYLPDMPRLLTVDGGAAKIN